MKKTKRLIIIGCAILFFGIIATNYSNAAELLYWPVTNHKNLIQDFHDGKAIDIGDANIGGANIYAAYNGTVTNVFNCNYQHFQDNHTCYGFGTGVVIQGDDGRFYQYAHMQAGSIPSNIYVGAHVNYAQFIGKVGTTGNSSIEHLHFGISVGNFWDKSGINPKNEQYFDYIPQESNVNVGDRFVAQIVPKDHPEFAVTADDVTQVSNVSLRTSNRASKNQQWEFVRQSDGSYTIINLASGLVLDVSDKGDSNNNNVRIAIDTKYVKQLWKIYPYNGGYRLVPNSASKFKNALDVYGANFKDGINMELYQANNTSNPAQTFVFKKYDASELISKTDIEGAEVRYTITKNGILVYNGQYRTPAVEVKLGDKILVKDKDYKVEYLDNKDVGIATTKITGIGDYTGVVTKTFEIKSATQSIEGAEVRYTITKNGILVYNGQYRTPAVEVKLGDKILAKDKDYKVEYLNNKDVGIATTKITGIGNYTGVVTKTFEIKSATQSIENAEVRYTVTKNGILVYNGNTRTLAVEVKLGDKILVKDKDYKVEYLNNQNAGIGTTKITGIGKYSGVVEKNFFIKTANLEKATVTFSITPSGVLVYNGKLRTPEVCVKLNNKVLVKNVDYKVQYINNKNIGTASVIITGIGNYSGETFTTFEIIK